MQKPMNPKEIIEKSGHALHLRIVELLKTNGWNVDISPYYVDAITEKSREIDIIAIKRKYIEREGRPLGDNLALKQILSIDCKYLSQNGVFWIDENENPQEALKFNNINIKSNYALFSQERSSLLEYQWDKVAKLFKTGTQKGGRTEDPMYKGISQAINGLIYARNNIGNQISVFHPVVVVSTGDYKLYREDNINSSIEKVAAHIDYTYYPSRNPQAASKREQFYVSIVTETEFSQFLNLLDQEMAGLNEYLYRILQ